MAQQERIPGKVPDHSEYAHVERISVESSTPSKPVTRIDMYFCTPWMCTPPDLKDNGNTVSPSITLSQDKDLYVRFSSRPIPST